MLVLVLRIHKKLFPKIRIKIVAIIQAMGNKKTHVKYIRNKATMHRDAIFATIAFLITQIKILVIKNHYKCISYICNIKIKTSLKNFNLYKICHLILNLNFSLFLCLLKMSFHQQHFMLKNQPCSIFHVKQLKISIGTCILVQVILSQEK